VKENQNPMNRAGFSTEFVENRVQGGTAVSGSAEYRAEKALVDSGAYRGIEEYGKSIVRFGRMLFT
jgi:hypothetical protein